MQQFRTALASVRRLYFVISQLNPDLPSLVQWKEMAFMLHIPYFIADIHPFRNQDIPLGKSHHTISESSSGINFISSFIHSLVPLSIYWEWLCLLSIVQDTDIVESSTWGQYIRICVLSPPLTGAMLLWVSVSLLAIFGSEVRWPPRFLYLEHS